MFKRHGRLLTLLAFLGSLALTVGPASWFNVRSQGASVTCSLDKAYYQIAEDGKTLSIKILLSAQSKDLVSVSLGT